MKKITVLLVLVLCLTPVRALAPVSQSGEVVAHALSQMGATEEEDEYTVYGERYGYPNGFWCDMFVSWCADEAGMTKEAFPRNVNCAKHSQAFAAMGQYRNSAARGGTYIPSQGDLVLFYNKEGRIHHVGLVLYVENGRVFTVEGNALTSRLDYLPEVVSEERIPEIEPCDYVTVNHYALEDPRLHGYAIPLYTSREPLELEGFVDLGRYSGVQEELAYVAASGLMEPTSSHTFSPRAGMSRGEFLKAALSLCGLFGWDDSTPAYDDVTMESPYFNAVMTARAAGLLPETEENAYHPELWISGEDAQRVLSGVLARLGMPDRKFDFTPGDLSQILTPYTTRGDIARALYACCEEITLETEVFTGFLTLWGQALDWPARALNGECYVPVPNLLAYFPELTVPGVSAAAQEAIGELGEDRAIRRSLALEAEGRTLRSRGFLWSNTLYVPIKDAAGLLSADLKAEFVE